MHDDQTIYALASGAGRSGVAVVRLSGAIAGTVVRTMAHSLPAPRRASLRKLTDQRGTVLDTALVLWFPGPNSFTGEDVAEMHLHGGPAVVAGVLDELARFDGVRLAEPGEFTRRAFENGRMDLTEAEGLADLINAETEAQRTQALRQMDGALGALYNGWRDQLVRALAHLEAYIDFPEEDLPEDVADQLTHKIRWVETEIVAHLADGHRGERLREGIHLAIIGPPNSGKSSLLNRLARREAAIVSPLAGTTRDVIEVHLDVGGYPVLVADTAGLRERTDNIIEREGIARARGRADLADLKLAVFDGAQWPEVDGSTAALLDHDTLVVINKCDVADIPGGPRVNDLAAIPVSAKTGAGLDEMITALAAEIGQRWGPGARPDLSRARHREALEGCLAGLSRFNVGALIELGAEDLRLAVRELGRITGRVDVEDLLDVIFSDFCIGK